MVFFWEYLKGGGEGHLFLNKIVDFGGPKSDIFIPKCTKEGGGGDSTGLGNIPKQYQFLFTASHDSVKGYPSTHLSTFLLRS